MKLVTWDERYKSGTVPDVSGHLAVMEYADFDSRLYDKMNLTTSFSLGFLDFTLIL